MTPFAPFDSASIPKAPRVPSDIDELQRKDIAERDTDQSPMIDEADEKTPAVPAESTLDMVLRRLGEVEAVTQDSKKMQQRIYDLLLKIDSDNKRARRRHAALARRVTTLEVTRHWVPALAWLATTLIALIALFRTYR